MNNNNNSINALLKVEIIAPEKYFSFDNVHMVILPGSEGEFGVLPGHVALVSALETGIVSIHGNHSKTLGRFLISAGFAEVTREAVVVLAEQIEEQT